MANKKLVPALKKMITIKPLFLPINRKDFSVNPLILQFANDHQNNKNHNNNQESKKNKKNDYNKAVGEALIGAGNDAEAIAIFLQEYKDSPETLRSYAKEVERLLLWCVHVAKVNVSSLRRNHLTDYQEFLKHPEPKKLWCGPSAARFKKDDFINLQ
jgi:hypothetical protein